VLDLSSRREILHLLVLIDFEQDAIELFIVVDFVVVYLSFKLNSPNHLDSKVETISSSCNTHRFAKRDYAMEESEYRCQTCSLLTFANHLPVNRVLLYRLFLLCTGAVTSKRIIRLDSVRVLI